MEIIIVSTLIVTGAFTITFAVCDKIKELIDWLNTDDAKE